MIRSIILEIEYYAKKIIFKIKWRRMNRHNLTYAIKVFPIEKVSVGKKTYGPLDIKSYNSTTEQITIGSYCSIAQDVRFLLGGEHEYNTLSTFPFQEHVCGITENTITKGPIIIKDDVWIGERSLILSGITIGQGAVIGAGSIVTKDVPPYAIVAGNPARIIKYRFSQDIIDKLLNIDFSLMTEENIKNNLNDLYTKINNDNVDDLLKNLNLIH